MFKGSSSPYTLFAFVSLCRHLHSPVASSPRCPLHSYTIHITSIQVAFHCGHRSIVLWYVCN